MIIRCHACGKRISDKMRLCPHCNTALAELSAEEIETLKRRHHKSRLFRTRMIAQLAMGVTVIGLLWWWLGGVPMVLDWPPRSPWPMLLSVLGLLTYVGGQGWLYYLRWRFRRENH